VQVLRVTELSASITNACTYGKQYVMVPDMYAHTDGRTILCSQHCVSAVWCQDKRITNV